MKLGIIDYGAGNLRSVFNTFSRIGVAPKIVKSPEDLVDLSHLVLPGVGAFGDCSQKLQDQNLVQPIKAWIAENKPFLGICVGYQVLFEESEEQPGIPGLGIFKGKVVRFPSGTGLKIPHMGWNSLEIKNLQSPIWEQIPQEPHFYFVHSYFPQPVDSSLISAECNYGIPFAAAIQRGSVFATQFHPEKSQRVGELLLQNFLEQPGT